MSEVRESLSLISKVGVVTCYQRINILAMETRVDAGVMIHIFVNDSMMTHIEREIVVNNVGVDNMMAINHVGLMMSNNVITGLLLMMGFRGVVVLRLFVGSCLAMMTFSSLGVSMTSFFVSFGMLGMLVIFSGLVMLLVLSWLCGWFVLFGGFCGVGRVGVVITLAINRVECVS